MRRKDQEETTRQERKMLLMAGQATLIPFLLVVCPFVGYFIGQWIDKARGTESRAFAVESGWLVIGRARLKCGLLIRAGARSPKGLVPRFFVSVGA